MTETGGFADYGGARDEDGRMNRLYHRTSVRRDPSTDVSDSTPQDRETALQIPMSTLEANSNGAHRVQSPSPLIPASQVRQTGYTESATQIRRKNLGILDVWSVIINKMVGTGIFTTPGEVLRLTGSKKVSTFLWAMGGVYTALCLTVYLELGTQFPHNGGELIYLGRIMKPGLLWALMFSAFFIMIANTTGNAIAFARFVMIAASPNHEDGDDLNPQVVKLIAVDVLSVVVLLHYFSGRLGLFLNKALALYKVCLLLAVLGATIWITRQPNHYAGLGQGPVQLYAGPLSNLSAFVLVLYSFTGWENANYIAGEISVEPEVGPEKTLRLGAYTAIAVVTLLYLLVSLLYYLAFTYCEIVEKLDLGMALNLGRLAFQPYGISLDVLFALSACGNLIAVVYTSAKVKQTIARQRVLPFWRFLEKDLDSPKGGLLLHWIFTTILIAATPVNSDGYAFVIGLYTYGQIVVVTFATIGFLYYNHPNQSLLLLKSKSLRLTIALIVILTNIFVLGMGAAQKKSSKIIYNTPADADTGPECQLGKVDGSYVSRWLWPAIVFSIFAFGALYWSAIRISMVKRRRTNDQSTVPSNTFGSWLGFKVSVYEVPDLPHSDNTSSTSSRWAKFINDSSTTIWPVSLNVPRAEAVEDGTRRRVDVQLSKFPQTVAKIWEKVVK